MTSFDPGGLTFSPSFVSEYDDTTPNEIGIPFAQQAIIKGLDDEEYYVVGGVGGVGGDADTLTINRADTGAVEFSITKAQMSTDARANISDAFMDNQEGGSFNGAAGASAFAVPDTEYVIVIVGAASGVDLSRAILYYRINASSEFELMGGWSGTEDGFGIAFRPEDSFGSSVYGAGHIVSDDAKVTGPNNAIAYQYPLAFTIYGDGESTMIAVPSINQILGGSLIETESSGVWSSKENELDGIYGANVLKLGDSPSSAEKNRVFFLPRESQSGSFMCQQFYLSDLEAHAAGTETTTNTYLDTHATTYETGLISATKVNIISGGNNDGGFGFATEFASTTVAFHTKWLNSDQSAAFPYPDSKETYAGGSGDADEDYYGQYTVYPYSETDPSDQWLIFVPRFYREAADRDKIGVRVFAWNPVTEKAQFLAFANGKIVDIGTDTEAGIQFSAASVNWNRANSKLTLLMRSQRPGGKGLVVADFGTFSPVIADAVVASETLKVRSWTFNLDGHSFYVSRFGEQGTYIYDTLTQQWSEWVTQGKTTWNAEHGVIDWNGNPVAGDQTEAFLWEIDPEGTLDEDVNPITRVVTAFIPHRERDPLQLGEVRITASVGAPSEEAAEISLRFSDDQGNTFSDYYTTELSSGEFSQVIRYRSLGRIVSPGRVLEVRDIGAAVRIDGMDIDLKAR